MSFRSLALRSVLMLGCVGVPAVAEAFCGFFVSGAEAPLHNSASQVVLMRNGNHTVLTMSNNYQGPPQNFAMVVPVPVVLKQEQVKTLKADVLRRIDQVSAPRLVEYWEQDPCRTYSSGDFTLALGSLGTIGRGSGGGGYGGGVVRIEAQFDVGEYQIVILSASDSTGLERWLHQNHYKIPNGAAVALAPYIADQQKFFVAKVNINKVHKDEHGVVQLSPLRFSYDASELRLPVRLGLLNASGPQDLLIYILHPTQRFEVANYPNIFIPTNLEVTSEVRKNFPGFYAELFDATLRQNGGRGVVTEYSWASNTCDPCPIPPLNSTDLVTLGHNERSTSTTPGIIYSNSRMGTPKVEGDLNPEVVQRIARRHINELKFCHEKELANGGPATGQLTASFVVRADGSVTDSKISESTVHSSAVESCMANAIRRWQFPSSPARVSLPVFLDTTSTPSTRSFGPDSYVLTRLHTRYEPKALSADLIFRVADPVVGGRADGNGTSSEQDAKVAKQGPNNFQGRYIIRNYWEKPVTCEKPNYGVWGGPPASSDEGLGGGTFDKARAATNLAQAPRGQVKLGQVIRTAIPKLGVAGIPLPARPKAATSTTGTVPAK